MANSKKEQTGKEDYSLTERGRRFMKEDRFMRRLSGTERKAYEECMSLLQTISENGNLEEVCELLEKYSSEETSGS